MVLTGREVVAAQSPSTPNAFREQAEALVCVRSLRVQTATNGAACPHPGKEAHTVYGEVLWTKMQMESQHDQLASHSLCTKEGEVYERWDPNP